MNNATKTVTYWLQHVENDVLRAEVQAAAARLLADRRRNPLESIAFKQCFPNQRTGITSMAEMLIKCAMIEVDWIAAARAISSGVMVSI